MMMVTMPLTKGAAMAMTKTMPVVAAMVLEVMTSPAIGAIEMMEAPVLVRYPFHHL